METADKVLEILLKKWETQKNRRSKTGIPLIWEWTQSEANTFGQLLLKLCDDVIELLSKADYPYLELKSPAIVLGDIHGSFDDLTFFLERLCPLHHLEHILPQYPAALNQIKDTLPPATINEPTKEEQVVVNEPKDTAESTAEVTKEKENSSVQHDPFGIADYVMVLENDGKTHDKPLSTYPRGRAVSESVCRDKINFRTSSNSGIEVEETHTFLFLGDYVDRGPASIECAAYLLALKLRCPQIVHLLRGNHELLTVNYQGNFISECKRLFGEEAGENIFLSINNAFCFLPLAASIDGRVFCAHGGIPRLEPDGKEDRLDLLKYGDWDTYRRPDLQTDLPEGRMTDIFNDLLWADPSDATDEINELGFGPNNRRGEGTIVYGQVAVDTFLKKYDFQLVLRAHEMQASGFRVGKGGKVLTVFSASRYGGTTNAAGAVVVNQKNVRLIARAQNLSPSVHREWCTIS